jgi:hypothetical protein
MLRATSPGMQAVMRRCSDALPLLQEARWLVN